jgi:hypothetical protein
VRRKQAAKFPEVGAQSVKRGSTAFILGIAATVNFTPIHRTISEMNKSASPALFTATVRPRIAALALLSSKLQTNSKPVKSLIYARK